MTPTRHKEAGTVLSRSTSAGSGIQEESSSPDQQSPLASLKSPPGLDDIHHSRKQLSLQSLVQDEFSLSPPPGLETATPAATAVLLQQKPLSGMSVGTRFMPPPPPMQPPILAAAMKTPSPPQPPAEMALLGTDVAAAAASPLFFPPPRVSWTPFLPPPLQPPVLDALASEALPPPPCTQATVQPGPLTEVFCGQLQPPPAQAPVLSKALLDISIPPPPTQEPAIDASTLADFPSVGSDHASGECKPCAFVYTRGCAKGKSCTYCHSCGPGERRRRRTKEKRQQIQM